MHLIFIIVSLIPLTVAAANPAWFSDLELLMNDSTKSEAARSRFNKNPKLDQELIDSLKKGGIAEKYALTAIRLLPRISMVDKLVAMFDKLDVESARGRHYFVTLASLAGTKKGQVIVDALSRKVSLTTNKNSSAIRITYLETLRAIAVPPGPKVLLKLLNDESYELREKAADIAREEVNKAPQKYVLFLKKAMQISPYSVRLKAIDAIASLSSQERKIYQAEVAHCVQKDQNEKVRLACGKVKI